VSRVPTSAPDGEEVPPPIARLFAPIHRRAFGVAVGTVSGLGTFLVTAAYLLVRPNPAPRLELLAQFFTGYSVSWPGALVGLAWGFVVGYCAGWFVAFTRNLVIALWIFLTRTRAELSAARTFLDHL
jgi:hypothetical protein